jgi:hypothetical protein
MNFTEIVNEVSSITKRPDKVVDIRREVNKAINFFCVEGTFARDRDELLVTLDANLCAQSIPLNQFTRFRKVEAIIVPYRKKPLDPTDPTKLFTKDGCDLRDAFYLAGDSINISLSQTSATCKVGYFKYPQIFTGTDTFWLMEVSPFMIIDRAASTIFFNIGDDASGKYHKGLADEAFVSAKRDYKYGVNYG